jgi:hypothetical protein
MQETRHTYEVHRVSHITYSNGGVSVSQESSAASGNEDRVSQRIGMHSMIKFFVLDVLPS